MTNEEKAKELTTKLELCCEFSDKLKCQLFDSCEKCYAYFTALKISEWKDICLKSFLKTFISIEYKGELDEFGNPISAEEYFNYLDERLKKAEDVFKAYKEFEKNI